MDRTKEKGAHGVMKRMAALAVSATLALGGVPATALAVTGSGDVNLDLAQKGSITVTAGQDRDGAAYDISGKDLRAVKLADLTAAVANAEAIGDHGANTVMTGFDLDTVQNLEPAINAAIKGDLVKGSTTVKQEDGSGLTSVVGEIEKTSDAKVDYRELDETNPMVWVVENLYGSASSPWAGEVRHFLSNLCVQEGVLGVASNGIQGQSVEPNVVKFSNLDPGVYAIFDMTQGADSRASFASIPMMQCTTVVNSDGAEVEWLKSDDVRTPLYQAKEIVRAVDVTVGGTTYKAGSVVNLDADLDADAWMRDSVTYTYTKELVYRTANSGPYYVYDAYGNIQYGADGKTPKTVTYQAGTIVYNDDLDAPEYAADETGTYGYVFGAVGEEILVRIGAIDYKYDEVPSPHKWIVENADDAQSDADSVTSEKTLDAEDAGVLSTRGERSWNVDRSLGEDIEYQIQSTVPVRTGYYTYRYALVDTMTDGLTFDPTRTIIQVEKLGIAEPVTLTEGVDYIQEVDLLDNGETVVTWTFGHIHTADCSCGKDNSLIGSFVADILPNENITDGATVYVDYRAHLDSDATTYEVDVNHVDLEYSNNWLDEASYDTVPAPEEPRVWTGEARIWKTDTTDHSLEGAEFQIYEQLFANGIAQFDANGDPIFRDEAMSLRELGLIDGVQTYQAATAKDGNHVAQPSASGASVGYHEITGNFTSNYVTTSGTDRAYVNGFLSSDKDGTFAGANGFGDPVSLVGGTNTDANDVVPANTMISPESGEILVKGLSDGYYKVVETRSPYGAQIIPTWTFKVTVTEGQNETSMVSNVASTTGATGQTVYKDAQTILDETQELLNGTVQSHSATVDDDGYVLVSDLKQDANKLVKAAVTDDSVVLEGTGNELTQKYTDPDGKLTYMQVVNARNITDMPQTGAVGILIRAAAVALVLAGALWLLRSRKGAEASV